MDVKSTQLSEKKARVGGILEDKLSLLSRLRKVIAGPLDALHMRLL